MDRESTILNEGFFDKISKFLRKIPKVASKAKGGIIKKLRVGLAISKLNKSIDSYEKSNRELDSAIGDLTERIGDLFIPVEFKVIED